jgi:hypothetical protein
MTIPLSELPENKIRSRVTTRMREFSVEDDGDFFVYVLECDPEIRLRRRLGGWNDKEMMEAVKKGEDSWLNYPARAKPPIGDYEFNYSPWVEQAVEADEVYYVGQTQNPQNRIIQHATADDEGAYATSLFPPERLIHIENVGDKQTAVALETLISEFITYGCVFDNGDFLNSSRIPDGIHDRIKQFADLPDADFEGGIHPPFLYSGPNDSRTANLVYRLNELHTVIAPWDEFEEMDGYPLAACHVSDWYITSIEQSASPLLSDYQDEILGEVIEKFESWLESSETYEEPCNPGEELDVDTGLKSPAAAEEYFWSLHSEGQKQIVEEFISENRKRVREMHPTPLRFAYADESPATKIELASQGGNDGLEQKSVSAASTLDELTEEERDRLKDVVEMAPTSNGKLQSRWGLDESADVHHYLESHLSEWYYRDSNSQIRPTDDVIDQI